MFNVSFPFPERKYVCLLPFVWSLLLIHLLLNLHLLTLLLLLLLLLLHLLPLLLLRLKADNDPSDSGRRRENGGNELKDEKVKDCKSRN